MCAVSIWCFGGFEMRSTDQHGDRVIDWAALRPRARAIMRLLAMRGGRPIHRDDMLAALWPEAAWETATRSLHVTLSSLRGFLDTQLPGIGRDLLRRDGEAYQLWLGGSGYPVAYLDVAAFRAAIDGARRARLADDSRAQRVALRQATECYHGDLLPEDGLADWVIDCREELRQLAARCAAELAAAELADSDFGSAAGFARRCVSIDRYQDDGWRMLIAACDQQGDLAAAARARSSYAEVLESLGLRPVAALV